MFEYRARFWRGDELPFVHGVVEWWGDGEGQSDGDECGSGEVDIQRAGEGSPRGVGDGAAQETYLL